LGEQAVGGFGGAESKLQIYSATKNEWSLGKFLPYGNAGSVNLALINNDKLLACGGLTAGTSKRSPGINHLDCYTYFISKNRWKKAAKMLVGVNHAAVGSTGDRVFIFGGRERRINVPDDGIDVVQIYTVSKNKWTFGPTMPIARGGVANAPYFGGLLWLIGGESSATDANPLGVLQSVVAFNPETTEWTAHEQMPFGLHGMYPVVDSVRNRLIVAGGGIKKGRSDTNTVLTFSNDQG
jgi:N-acetylneuraminic acid mutarotase